MNVAKILLVLGLLAANLAVAATALVAAKPVGIASGERSGTNWPMAEDIRAVCGTPGTPINNVASSGSLDNIYKIYSDSTVQYGIVQEDALVYQQGLDAQMMARIMMVFPFFSTEIHIVVAGKSPIRSLADLKGKRVVEGPKDSGTWVTSNTIKKLTGVQWEGVSLSLQDGLAAVRDGKADAEILVAGAPIALLANAAGLRLIDLSHPVLDAFKYYKKTRIRSGIYPFQAEAVDTYKVQNALATFAFKYEHQKEIEALVTCIACNIEGMQTDTRRHPKWKDVTPLEINRVTWPAHPAAVRAINKVNPALCRPQAR